MAAPTTLPMPPTITTMSEASSRRVSSPGAIDSSTEPITPPRPARPAPMAKVVANTRFTFTPDADEHAAVIDAGADHHADARAVEEQPQRHADGDADRDQRQAVGRVGLDHRDAADRAVQPIRRRALVHLRADRPHQQVGDHDRQADGHHRLAQVLPLHEAEDRHLHQQTRQRRDHEAHDQREQNTSRCIAR